MLLYFFRDIASEHVNSFASSDSQWVLAVCHNLFNSLWLYDILSFCLLISIASAVEIQFLIHFPIALIDSIFQS